MSKGDIGALYCKIDPHYQTYRPDNAYRAVERACKAKQGNPSDPMLYYKEQGKGLPEEIVFLRSMLASLYM